MNVNRITGQKEKESITLYSQKTSTDSTDAPIVDRAAYLAWRAEAAEGLEAAGLVAEAALFRSCQRHYDVDICVRNIDHAPRPIPYTCHLRYCPDCERREQARKLARYVPAVHDLLTLGRDGYSLKHIVLTTPYELADPDAPNLFKNAWRALEKVFDRVFVTLLNDAGKLSDAEKRRWRPELKRHGIGILAAAEFGEQGHKLHFHLLAYCPYIPIDFLVQCWQSVTNGDCEVSWIEKVELEQVEKAVIEVSKYVTKFVELPPSLVPALHHALSGSKRLRSYGSLRSLPAPERTPCECPICSASRISISVLDYLKRCIDGGISPDGSIVKVAENAAL